MSHYADMGNDLRQIPRWSDRVKYLFMKPGWLPDYMGGPRAVPDVDSSSYQKYDTPSPLSLNLYVLFQYVLCLAGTAIFLFIAGDFTTGEQVFITILITSTVVNCGVLFEQRRWVKWAEWVRIIAYPLLLSVLTFTFELSNWNHGISLVYLIISFTWFYSLQRQHEHLQVA